MALSKYDIDFGYAEHRGSSHAHMVELVGSNKRVLDVGCDTGYLGEALQAFGNTVSGVEFNPVSANAAAEKLERVVVGDIETMDFLAEFGPAAFDVIVYGDVLEHLRDPLAVLRQARGLLAPGGSVVISTPNIAHGDVRLALLSGRFDYAKLGILDETHTRFFTRDSLTRFVEDAGMVIVELRRTKLGLFDTELPISRDDFDPALVEQLASDEEAITYQFVIRATPEDAVTYGSAIALDLDRARTEIEDLRRRLQLAAGQQAEQAAAAAALQDEVAAGSAERERLQAEAAELRAETARLHDHASGLAAQLAESQDVIARFEQTKAVRAARALARLRPR